MADCFRARSEAEVSAYSGGRILKPVTVLQAESINQSAEAKRLSVEVESPIGPTPVFIDVAYAQVGTLVTFLKVSSGLSPVETQLFKEMARLAVRRTESAAES